MLSFGDILDSAFDDLEKAKKKGNPDFKKITNSEGKEVYVLSTPNKKKVVDLTTPKKIDKHFSNLREGERKQRVKDLTDEELPAAYDEIINREKRAREVEYLSTSGEPTKNKSSEYFRNRIVENKKSISLERKKLISNNKKTRNHYLEDLSKRIEDNATFDNFKEQFQQGLLGELKNLKLSLSDFTTKELERFYDYSRNQDKKKFGL